MERKQIGRVGLSMAINYFTLQGYTISVPLNDTQWYDLIIEKDGIFQTVQCKATMTEDSEINLSSTGGTNGGIYDNVLNYPKLDYLFCVNRDLKMWNIPLQAIREAGNTKSIRLREEKNQNNQGFQTCYYRVVLPNEDKPNIVEHTFKKKEPITHPCVDCGDPCSIKAIRCNACENKRRAKKGLEDCPVTREELKNLIKTIPFTQIGKQFNVSDNAIRKWCKKYNLPSTKGEINKYPNEEWELI